MLNFKSTFSLSSFTFIKRFFSSSLSAIRVVSSVYLRLLIFLLAEEAEVEWFYEDLQDLLELTPKKDVLFIIGDWNAKVGSKEIPGVTSKFGLGIQNEAGQRLTVLPRECTSDNKHPFPTTQEKTLHVDITRLSIPKSD